MTIKRAVRMMTAQALWRTAAASTVARVSAAVLGCTFFLCAGCTKTPEPADIARHLSATLGEDAPYRIAQVTMDTAPGADGRLLITYKAELLADDHLFLPASSVEELEKAGWKEADLDSAIQRAVELPPDLVTKVEKNKPRRAKDIVLLKQTVTAGDKRVWAGSVEGNYAESRWGFSNPQNERREPFAGSRRRAFPPDAVVIGTPEAAKLLAEEIATRKSYVEAVAWAQSAHKERVGRGQAEVRAAAAAAKASQATELARQKALASQRPIPLRVAFRRAAMGRGAVAVVQNVSAETLELRLTIADRVRTVRRLIRLGPAVTTEIGWAQGWDFKSGDTLAFEHRNYQPMKYRAP